MELEELKELWDDSSNSSFPINEEGLSKILNQSSRRPIALIKRNLKLEVLFVILLYGFLIWLILNQVDSNILYVDIILLVLAGILFCVRFSVCSVGFFDIIHDIHSNSFCCFSLRL